MGQCWAFAARVASYAACLLGEEGHIAEGECKVSSHHLKVHMYSTVKWDLLYSREGELVTALEQQCEQAKPLVVGSGDVHEVCLSAWVQVMHAGMGATAPLVQVFWHSEQGALPPLLRQSTHLVFFFLLQHGLRFLIYWGHNWRGSQWVVTVMGQRITACSHQVNWCLLYWWEIEFHKCSGSV